MRVDEACAMRGACRPAVHEVGEASDTPRRAACCCSLVCSAHVDRAVTVSTQVGIGGHGDDLEVMAARIINGSSRTMHIAFVVDSHLAAASRIHDVS